MAVFSGTGDMRSAGLDFLAKWKAAAEWEPGTTITSEIHHAEEMSFQIREYTLSGSFEYFVDPDTMELETLVGTVNKFEFYFEDFIETRVSSFSISNFSIDISKFDGSLTGAQIVALIFDGNDRIEGGNGDDFLLGYNGNDTVIGGFGDDHLDGGVGRDIMMGEAGDDTYYVDNYRDVVWEFSGEGTDEVFSTISYTLPENVERLYLTGTGDDIGIGNAVNNVLNGNAGANTLDGRKGRDSMYGGAGDDT
ncbi:calcium-binding protein, partial [Shinella sp.]